MFSSIRKNVNWHGRLSKFAKQIKASAGSKLSRSIAAMKDIPWTWTRTWKNNWIKIWYKNILGARLFWKEFAICHILTYMWKIEFIFSRWNLDRKSQNWVNWGFLLTLTLELTVKIKLSRSNLWDISSWQAFQFDVLIDKIGRPSYWSSKFSQGSRSPDLVDRYVKLKGLPRRNTQLIWFWSFWFFSRSIPRLNDTRDPKWTQFGIFCFKCSVYFFWTKHENLKILQGMQIRK